MSDKPLPWIQVASDLEENDKFKGFANRSGLDPLQAVGALLRVWFWFARKYPPGRAPKEKFDIVAILELDEEAAIRVFHTLQRVGFVEVMEGEIVLHDWEKYAGKAIQNRERQRRYWGKQKDGGQTSEVGAVGDDLTFEHENQTSETIPEAQCQTSESGPEVGNQTFGVGQQGVTVSEGEGANVRSETATPESGVYQTSESIQTTKTTKTKAVKEKESDAGSDTEPDVPPEDSAITAPAVCSSLSEEGDSWDISATEDSLRLLVHCGITPDVAGQLASCHHPKKILRHVERFAKIRGSLSNPAGWLRRAIEKDRG